MSGVPICRFDQTLPSVGREAKLRWLAQAFKEDSERSLVAITGCCYPGFRRDWKTTTSPMLKLLGVCPSLEPELAIVGKRQPILFELRDKSGTTDFYEPYESEDLGGNISRGMVASFCFASLSVASFTMRGEVF